jgi:methionyl aminopeptidase
MVPNHDMIKTPEQLEGIRESSKINIAVLDEISDKIHEGMCTEDIDVMVNEITAKMGGIPAPLNYDGYPKSVCVSINEVVCHGIPCKERFLQSGDIVNVDVSTIYKGYFSDSSRMYMIGDVPEEKQKLVRVAKECVEKGLEQVKPWNFLGDMAQAVNDHAKANGYSVVREIGGHGVGLEFHEEPFVSYVTSKGTEMLMVPGMVFTIEPMVNMGKADIYIDDKDGWTVYTEDGKPSAQWEVTLAVTEDGYEILTY